MADILLMEHLPAGVGRGTPQKSPIPVKVQGILLSHQLLLLLT